MGAGLFQERLRNLEEQRSWLTEIIPLLTGQEDHHRMA